MIAGSMGVWGWMMSHVEYGVWGLDGVIWQRMGAHGARVMSTGASEAGDAGVWVTSSLSP